MKRQQVVVSLLAIALVALSIGTATAWFADSETLRFEITAAGDFEDVETKVWVCKIVGPPDDLQVKPGVNPIHVSANSLDADDAFSDTHPSYVVENGDVVCVVPETDNAEPEARVSPATEEAEPPESTTTTATTTTQPSTTTSTVAAATTTTTLDAITTTIPDDPSTTTTATLDNDG